ncbi:cupin domain-containing protein [Marinomonas mediterranea]|jgi:Cupin domain.|uniref:Cupin 2 conserved barrel domain protein n=1 Tax=Marinomonas mediterranea (strain ATCC 700492 / JCM 21426 / NBRC 103028 / MMB-1) TaxID=717774 RepID=F2K2E2_MARM1|nr:cupin domain-containing protein [Marinomonas mediterranea]ADZ92322.1 Cupin 2 conserved barrel domain protein [Marinomonas mediterranea MMB-1]WCN10274.1 cupin domain-containing protein [Marinomonas mediterranea]WCN14321.1 cupin domain-containing protein [Marinomonas mediterranea]WCN18373.1 cupin domain-containing protein [Marinomonas mediterranea MMB-1]
MKSTSLVRRVVTGHDEKGNAVIWKDNALPPQYMPQNEDAEFTLIWSTAELPVDNNDPVDGIERDAGVTLKGGSVIRVVDMLPGKESPMHRTNSLDYGVVISGELELVLDDGVNTRLYPGDIVVQRGTIHQWRNPSDVTTCRIVFVLTEAFPVNIKGTPLEEVHP